MKKCILFIVMLLSIKSFSQNLQNNNWILSNSVPGVNFGSTSISTFPFPQIPSSPPLVNLPFYLEGSATLSDQNGNLLLFSDGVRLWRNNQGAMATLITSNLLGDGSSTQNVIFIPKPGNPNIYYVVTINGLTSQKKGLYYSEVDLSSNSIVSPINRPLSTGTFFDNNFNQINSLTINQSFLNDSQSITSTKHSNGKDYWLVAHVQNAVRGILLSFKVTCNGILNNTADVAQEFTLPDPGNNLAHSLKISPNGSRIAFNTQNGIYYGGFNNTTGAINLNNNLNSTNSSFNYGYGLEFSPNSDVLFYSDGNGVVARNLVTNSFTNVVVNTQEPGIQLARDGRIYISDGFLTVVNSPNTINDLQVTTSSIISSAIGLPQWVHWQQNSTPNIIAQNDVLNVNSCVASSISVLQNNSNGTDLFNSNPLTNLAGNCTLSIVGALTPIPLSGSITLNTTNGLLTVAAGTSPGTYKLKYKLCTLGACPNCSNDAEVTINVSSSQNNVPTFTLPSSICVGSAAPVLPTTSTNGITGTWSPAVVSNTTTGTYTFTPTAGLCANTFVVTITVTPKVTPTFSFVTSICSGSVAPILPTTSINGITGTWSPAIVSNTTTGNYTFTPTTGLCANAVIKTITVTPKATPTFTLPSSICVGSTSPILPTTSTNGITGTWSPITVSNTTTGNYTFTPTAGLCANIVVKTITVTPKITPTFSFATSICSGSVAPILPTTSTNGITGTWSPTTVSNTTSGNYTFTPTAGLCANVVVKTVTVNPSITSTFNIVNSICFGSNPPILPTTSVNGISGTWSPSTVSNTATGTYTFTPSSIKCGALYIKTITVNSVTPTFSFATSICSGSVAPVLPTTSTNGITGTWSPAIVSNTTTGTYTFTPNVGQCAVTVTKTITVNANVVPVFSINTLICNGCTAPILPLTSNNGITGTWNPSVVNNSVSATYTFTPNAGQCATTTSINITIAASLPTQNCFGFDPVNPEDVTNEGTLNYGYIGSPYGTPISSVGLTFTWHFRLLNGTLLTFNEQNPIFRQRCPYDPNNLENGLYPNSSPVMSFALIVSNGLQTRTYRSIVSGYPIPGISGANTPTCFIHPDCLLGTSFKSDSDTINEIKVYPNPTNSILKFEGKDLNNYKVSIYNNNGYEIIKDSKINETISIENQQNGVYLYKITDENGFEQTGKIIKE
ncbi:T9SS type A sorting domain-containing protein [Flavobacterium sp.]|uniref:T9SS type A sorting domain-containing protein n=1 Tax=Flavobacterium sp. TaxID=239 RepID=UPI00260440FD|nr:T9SS type A sorting domain-containing protein [Flavobacterium sp.]